MFVLFSKCLFSAKTNCSKTALFAFIHSSFVCTCVSELEAYTGGDRKNKSEIFRWLTRTKEKLQDWPRGE